MQSHKISLLGTGLIGMFYTMSIHGKRSRDRVEVAYSRTAENGSAFAKKWDIPHSTSDLDAAINHPDTDVVVIGLPNDMHEDVVARCAAAKKAVLCTKPLGRNAAEARRMLDTVERAGIFAGYLEDLVYTPKTLKSIQAVQSGSIGEVLWARSREAHPGPHSAWFWDIEKAGGGALIDLGCHCIEIVRSFAGKLNRPVEVMCWADSLVHPVDAEDHAIVLIHFESGAMGQVEVSWAFHGGMDLRDEVSGTQGTIWLNHWMRTGFEMFTKGGKGYVAEKSEAESGWVFPVGDEGAALGYDDMFADMFDSMDNGRAPRETFYDGYVVNAVLDAAYLSARTKAWVPVNLEDWRAEEPASRISVPEVEIEGSLIIKEERLPSGQIRRIYKDKQSGEIGHDMIS